MHHTDTSKILLDGMQATLDAWVDRHGGAESRLYWLLALKMAEINGQRVDELLGAIADDDLRADVAELRSKADSYFDDVRYSSLEPVTVLWGTVVNSLRVAAESERATDVQQQVFSIDLEELVSFFRAARDRMEVADSLYHAFKAMPAPECQALAALLNVHVDAPVEAAVVVRLVRLVDHEGPMSPREAEDLAALSNTHLVSAAFSGLRQNA